MAGYSFPVVRISGRPYERGVQYGTAAASQIHNTIEAYTLIFKFLTGWEWQDAQHHAHNYFEPIQQHTPHLIAEMRGIAHGAGVSMADIMALNVRTEIINAARARAAKECTAFVLPPGLTNDKHILIGQNWDWNVATAASVIILEVESAERPHFVTIVEAGLLAKCGMNAAGIGLATNAMNSSLDCGEAGLPYHVILRSILESESLAEAEDCVLRPYRASAANYLIAHQSGQAVNIEVAPGKEQFASTTMITDSLFCHTNHYLHTQLPFNDLVPQREPDTLLRYNQFMALIHKHTDKELTPKTLANILADHHNYPSALCCHSSANLHPAEQYATIASVIMDLNTRKMCLAQGNPCAAPFLEREYASFLNQHYS
ncbi:MAG: hypothetical protein KDE48_12690 [Anaerolineales bacterium]|nr:hypothetical protein [Anaerolineales bacterium]